MLIVCLVGIKWLFLLMQTMLNQFGLTSKALGRILQFFLWTLIIYHTFVSDFKFLFNFCLDKRRKKFLANFSVLSQKVVLWAAYMFEMTLVVYP
jgi:hypothetical protein